MKTLRGISPVVATALLVLIAVAVSVLLYTWVSGTVGTQPTASSSLEERIKIDAVNATAGSTTVTVYVHNIGKTDVTIQSVYIIDADTGKVLGSTTPGITLTPGEVQGISVTLNSALTSGTTILAKAVTSNGVEATYIEVVR